MTILLALVRVLTLALEIALLPAILYLTLLSAAALAGGSREPRHSAPGIPADDLSDASPMPTFAFLIPAHDEEALIGSTLASLHALDYPADRWRAIVVADNCSDATAAVARAAGAEVYERTDLELRAKGYALAWLLARLEPAEAHPNTQANTDASDAYIVLDADSVVSPNFLRALAKALADGAKVAQARYQVRNGARADAAGLRAVAFALFNHVRPLGRRTLGWSAGLKGNGMCFRRDILRDAGWGAYALAEDVEYHAALLRAGIHVRYVPEAVVEGEMPTSLHQARTQQARWERGRVEQIRRQVPALLRRFAHAGDLACLDAALEIALPPLALVVLALAACVAGALVTRWAPVEIVAGALCAGLAVHLLAGALLARVSPRAWLSLLAAPVYIVWKGWIYLAALRTRRQMSWVRTERVATTAGEPVGKAPLR